MYSIRKLVEGKYVYLDKNGEWTLLCDKTQTYGPYYSNRAASIKGGESFKYIRKNVIPGDVIIVRVIEDLLIMGVVTGFKDGLIEMYGMENFEITLSDLVRVVSERRAVIRASYKVDEDDDGEEVEEGPVYTYYNSGAYFMSSDKRNATLYRTKKYAIEDYNYVNDNIEGDVRICPINMDDRSYSYKIVKDCHPETFENLDLE